MNTGNIYECKIYQKTDEFKRSDGKLISTGVYVKDAIVQPSKYSSRYTDVQTGEEYYVGLKSCFVKVGSLYISSEHRIIPFNTLTENTRQNMPKRKVLKKYQEYKKQNRDKELKNE